MAGSENEAPITKILVVDDDAFVRDMLGFILESSGYDVETAENGVEALLKYRQGSEVSLIISDMDMPEMDGLTLIREVRKLGADPETPIIILTGNSEIKIAVEAINNGASKYLLKDENIQDTVLICVEKSLEKYWLQKENQKLMRELERLSLADGLTGIYNRRYFDRIIEREWSRAIRESLPISLIMIDIDFFKLYNDTYGHQSGDDCLVRVARTLDQSLNRSIDFVCRYGGEEFAAILPHSDLSGAVQIAERMRDNVQALKILHSASEVSDIVSISIGVGTIVPQRNWEFKELITLADESLYDAKRGGRNCIKTADPL